MSLPCFIGKVSDSHIIIESQEYHHAVNVKKLKINDKIEVNDLNGNCFVATINKIEKNYLIAIIDSKITKDIPKTDITLYQCLPNKLSKIDELIEPISQLNVKTFIPVISQHCALKPKDIQNKIAKWEKIAIQSIKQCKRLFPVIIEKQQNLFDINPKEQLKIVFYENEKNNTLKSLKIKTFDSIAIVIGPEGGFCESEILHLQKKGFIALSLSKNILKTEVATISALAQIELMII
ncbi:16S rRNA (uracil(1498)-N(3))-methyltransferase [Desulfurella sp.]|uniref:RsmE family RNA methyltransferase n=1 Tax=Desulfurella sp. TaxID=1962857 RepID=UPI0025C0A21D|nr:16S rRNA (uracil(1498)-N(3))-methyltransferase [Desulfurella sp.]